MEHGEPESAALIAAHQAAKKRLRAVRIVFPLLVISLVVFNVYALAQQVKSVDPNDIAAGLESEFHKLWPRIEEDLTLVASNLEPVLSEELEKQAAALGPKLDKRLERDVEELKRQVEADFMIELERALDEIERRQRSAIVEHIPEFKGNRKAQDRVLEQVRVSLTKWCMKQLTSTLHEHMLAMEQIRKTLQRSYIAKAGAKVDMEETVSIWLELMNESVGGDDTILAPRDDMKPTPKRRKASKGKE